MLTVKLCRDCSNLISVWRFYGMKTSEKELCKLSGKMPRYMETCPKEVETCQ